jgi:hypothetical protein
MAVRRRMRVSQLYAEYERASCFLLAQRLCALMVCNGDAAAEITDDEYAHVCACCDRMAALFAFDTPEMLVTYQHEQAAAELATQRMNMSCLTQPAVVVASHERPLLSQRTLRLGAGRVWLRLRSDVFVPYIFVQTSTPAAASRVHTCIVRLLDTTKTALITSVFEYCNAVMYVHRTAEPQNMQTLITNELQVRACERAHTLCVCAG